MSDMNQLLLSLLLNKQGGQANVEEMLGNDNDLDPMTRTLLSQALSTSNSQEDDSDEPDPEESDRGARRHRAIQRLRARFKEMQQQIEEMQWQLEVMETHNDELAAALGACYLCWGQDPSCPECDGQGKPGSVVPDWSLFKQWVLPAVKAAQAVRAQRLKRKIQSIQSTTKEEKQNAG